KVRGHGDRRLLLALGEDLEQQLRPSRVELDVAELIEAQQIEPSVACNDAREPTLVGGLDEFVHQLRSGHVSDAKTLLACGHPEPDQQMRLAGARVSEQDDRLAG